MTKERLPERSQLSESTQRNLKREGEGLLRPPWLSPQPYILYTYTTGPSKIILFACQEKRTVKKCVITLYPCTLVLVHLRTLFESSPQRNDRRLSFPLLFPYGSRMVSLSLLLLPFAVTSYSIILLLLYIPYFISYPIPISIAVCARAFAVFGLHLLLLITFSDEEPQPPVGFTKSNIGAQHRLPTP